MNWIDAILELGMSAVILVAIGWFFNKKIWPWITKQIEDNQKRMDEKDKRVIAIQEQHRQDTLRIIENYEKHTNAQLLAQDHHLQHMIEIKNTITSNHNVVMTELQYLKEKK